MNTPKVSVVVCTHNPRENYLKRVLDALRAQTLPFSDWELILVDNASSEPLAGRFDLSWHPAGRHVPEKELGLTPARLRGIAEARGETLVFVDDDNVLASNYLVECALIDERYPFLGAWGGSIAGEFEVPPEPWAIPYLPHLAIREVAHARWSNDMNDWPATPVGAGLCVRKAVAERYRIDLLSDSRRRALDRRGESLDGAGDLDLAYTAAHFDLGWGTFPSLALVHLVPSARTTKQYLLRITEASATSLVLLGTKPGRCMPRRSPVPERLARSILILARNGCTHVRFYLAQQRGIDRGYRGLAVPVDRVRPR